MAIRLLVCYKRTVIPNYYKLYHGNGLLGFLYKLKSRITTDSQSAGPSFSFSLKFTLDSCEFVIL
jgi:hypothetical protein